MKSVKTGRKDGATVQEIDKIHANIAKQFLPFLQDRVVIGMNRDCPASWKRRLLSEDIIFEMWNAPNGIGQIMALRKGGRGHCPAIRLKPEYGDAIGESPFVSWREVWTKRAEQDFILKSAAFTFFWGRSAQVEEQLFRAEWVQDYAHDRATPRAAHPHWHIDWYITPDDLDMSGIHLAMGGWDFASSDSEPACWQTYVEGDWDRLVLWATRSLAYARHQLMYFPLAEGGPPSVLDQDN